MLIREDEIRATCLVMQDTKIQFGQSKNKGTPHVRVYLEVTEGPYTGYRNHWDGWLGTEDSQDRTIEAMRKMGWQGNDIENIDISELRNAVEVVFERDEDENGQSSKYHRAKWINSRGGRNLPVQQPMARDALRQMSARLRKRAESIRVQPLVAYERPDPATQPGPSTTGAPPSETYSEPPAEEYREGDYGKFEPPAGGGYGPPPQGNDDIPF